jgi:paraquat-inducible protein B
MYQLRKIGLALNLLLGILYSQTVLSQNGASLQQLTNSLENCDRSDMFKSYLLADFRIQSKEAKQLETNLRAQITNLSITNESLNNAINVVTEDNEVLKVSNEKLTKDLMASTTKVKDQEKEIVILEAKLFKRPIIWGVISMGIGILSKLLIK